jgi:hypothetical protein
MIESEEHNFSIFDRYRNGDLSDSELKEFEARLSYDSEFKASFDEFEAIEDGIKTHFRNQLKTKLQEVDKNMDSEPKRLSGKLRFLTWGALIAAALVIGFFVFQQFNKPTHLNIAQHYWPHEEGLPVKMSSKGKYDDAMNAFKLQEYEQASLLLHRIDSDTAHYFLGIIAYHTNEYEKSSLYFAQIETHSKYYQDAQFRLALVSMLIGELDVTKRILKSQIDNKTLFEVQAISILSELD